MIARTELGPGIDVVAVVARDWLIVAAGVVLGAVLGVALAFLLPKRYQAVVVVAPASGQQGASGLAGLIGQFSTVSKLSSQLSLSEGGSVAEYLAVLQSRRFFEDLIVAEGLLPALFPESWDGRSRTWTVPADEAPTTADGARRLADDIVEVRNDPDSGLVRIIVTHTDPAAAADWANTIVDRLNELARKRAIQDAETALAYLRQRLDGTAEVALRDALNALIESNLQRIMLANVRADFAFRVIDPALAPQVDDYVSPRRILVVLMAGIAGLLGTLGIVIARERITLSRRLEPASR